MKSAAAIDLQQKSQQPKKENQHLGAGRYNYGSRRVKNTCKSSVILVLTFCCSDCDETINGGDYESADQIFAKLEEHAEKCPAATFTFDGTTDVARQRVSAWRSVIAHERLVGRLRLR
jgi:hypothetical protein